MAFHILYKQSWKKRVSERSVMEIVIIFPVDNSVAPLRIEHLSNVMCGAVSFNISPTDGGTLDTTLIMDFPCLFTYGLLVICWHS